METNFAVLSELGLTPNQSRAYQLLLEKGPQKASDVAQTTGMKRALVYRTLDELVELGCAERDEHIGKVLHYTATHPSALRILAEKRVADAGRTLSGLDAQLGALSSLYNLTKGKPGVEFYEGVEGARRVLWDSLTSTEEIWTYADVDTVDAHIGDLNREYVEQRLRRKIGKRILSPDSQSARAEVRALAEDPLTEMRLMQGGVKMPFAAAVQIYDGKVSFLTFTDRFYSGTIIHDPQIYAVQRFIFEFGWNLADVSRAGD